MPWAVEAVDDYMTNVRPWFGFGSSGDGATERGGRLNAREIDDRFALYRRGPGWTSGYRCIACGRPYVTHMVEDGLDPKFLQAQVGHVYQSTTSLYTAVSGDFANTIAKRSTWRACASPGRRGTVPDRRPRNWTIAGICGK